MSFMNSVFRKDHSREKAAQSMAIAPYQGSQLVFTEEEVELQVFSLPLTNRCHKAISHLLTATINQWEVAVD
jgi:hypothetical protein